MKSMVLAVVMLLSCAFSGPTLQDLLKKSDDLFNSFDNKEALQVLRDANNEYPDNAEILWRMCRAQTHIADHMPVATDDQKDEQLQAYQEAYNNADRAVKADGNNSMAYTYRAVANGKVALFKGVFSVAPIVKQVREDCERAIALDPNNAIPYYILGRTHAKLAEKPKLFRWPLGLAWGNMDDAIKFYEKAVGLDGNFVMFRLDLAKAYDEQEEYQKAREQLWTIPGIPKRDEDDDSLKTAASSLLQDIKDK
ncbi:MAG TPA: tetratricopeptide repeat protein [Candidatus Kryptonia bacterium]